MTDHTTPPELLDWNRRLSGVLGIPEADIDTVLGLAGVVAHEIVRPAAPVSTYLVGYATALRVAAGASPDEAFAQAVAATRALARPES